jgi:hypothetical protein
VKSRLLGFGALIGLVAGPLLISFSYLVSGTCFAGLCGEPQTAAGPGWLELGIAVTLLGAFLLVWCVVVARKKP